MSYGIKEGREINHERLAGADQVGLARAVSENNWVVTDDGHYHGLWATIRLTDTVSIAPVAGLVEQIDVVMSMRTRQTRLRRVQRRLGGGLRRPKMQR